MFYDPAGFAFTTALERDWRSVYDEYLGIRHDLRDWGEKKLYDAGWQVFGLFDFPGGAALDANTVRCPVTTSLVQTHVPRHGAAGFSVLHPGMRIRPHQGYQGPFLRGHLALRVPDGDCGLTVGGVTRGWQVGKVVVFDDRLPHEAWNLTEEERVVLLFDFVPEE